jgi:hypothetical protein
MALLNSGDKIIASAQRKTEEFEVPEWGGSVLLRELTGRERDKFESSMVERRGNNIRQNFDNLRARLISICVVNEQGELLFNKADLNRLGDMPAAGLDRVFAKCQELNGLTQKDVEDLAEGFDSDTSEGSTSD